jgi:hypothetical protein
MAIKFCFNFVSARFHIFKKKNQINIKNSSFVICIIKSECYPLLASSSIKGWTNIWTRKDWSLGLNLPTFIYSIRSLDKVSVLILNNSQRDFVLMFKFSDRYIQATVWVYSLGNVNMFLCSKF